MGYTRAEPFSTQKLHPFFVVVLNGMTLILVCSLFMIGRNSISLFTKIRDLTTLEKRVALNQSKSQYFVYAALILTALAGIASGVSLLFVNPVFGFSLYYLVSGMMIYSYITYAGITYEQKHWIMFAISILVIIVIIVLASLLALAMAAGRIT
jgi:hypothetical protein